MCIKAWIKGRVLCFTVVSDVDSDEYGTDCRARIVVRGPIQLNKSRHRLQELSNLAIALVRSPHLVMERPKTVLFNLRNIDLSRAPKAFSADCFARNVAWPNRYSFIKYWMSFWGT